MKLPWRTLTVAAAALAAAAVPSGLELFPLDREALAAGQLWRLVTGHLVHGSAYHLGLDLAAWILAGLLFEPVLGRRYWIVLATSATCIDAGFLFLEPGLAAYCGLSGLLNGVMAAGALGLLAARWSAGHRPAAALALLFLLGLLGKIAVEGLAGEPLFSETARLGATPMPLSHALGALGGVLARPAARLPAPTGLSIPV